VPPTTPDARQSRPDRTGRANHGSTMLRRVAVAPLPRRPRDIARVAWRAMQADCRVPEAQRRRPMDPETAQRAGQRSSKRVSSVVCKGPPLVQALSDRRVDMGWSVKAPEIAELTENVAIKKMPRTGGTRPNIGSSVPQAGLGGAVRVLPLPTQGRLRVPGIGRHWQATLHGRQTA